MKIDTNNQNHILAEEGMVFKRISDGFIYGEEIYLGYTHYLNGELLDEPLLELPEHFEEIKDKAPFWELSDEDFDLKVANGEIVYNEELRCWENVVTEEPEINPETDIQDAEVVE